VLDQTAVKSGRVELEYIVVDAGSTDSTTQILRRFESGSLRVISERDKGMYDGLAKGLRQATGTWVSYLNAGDVYDPSAFDTLLDATANRPVRWITGSSALIDESGRLVRTRLPYRYRRTLVLSGHYCRRPPFYLPFIQQEGTFWHSTLNDRLDLDRLAAFRLAGDHFLWSSFATIEEPTIVAARLGAFRRHAGQLSEDRRAYRQEVLSIATRTRLADSVIAPIDALLWYAPTALKKFLNSQRLLVFDPEVHGWR
jgi:glycosyltransferase involved in cell wall biosynthesis